MSSDQSERIKEIEKLLAAAEAARAAEKARADEAEAAREEQRTAILFHEELEKLFAYGAHWQARLQASANRSTSTPQSSSSTSVPTTPRSKQMHKSASSISDVSPRSSPKFDEDIKSVAKTFKDQCSRAQDSIAKLLHTQGAQELFPKLASPETKEHNETHPFCQAVLLSVFEALRGHGQDGGGHENPNNSVVSVASAGSCKKWDVDDSGHFKATDDPNDNSARDHFCKDVVLYLEGLRRGVTALREPGKSVFTTAYQETQKRKVDAAFIHHPECDPAKYGLCAQRNVCLAVELKKTLSRSHQAPVQLNHDFALAQSALRGEMHPFYALISDGKNWTASRATYRYGHVTPMGFPKTGFEVLNEYPSEWYQLEELYQEQLTQNSKRCIEMIVAVIAMAISRVTYEPNVNFPRVRDPLTSGEFVPDCLHVANAKSAIYSGRLDGTDVVLKLFNSSQKPRFERERENYITAHKKLSGCPGVDKVACMKGFWDPSQCGKTSYHTGLLLSPVGIPLSNVCLCCSERREMLRSMLKRDIRPTLKALMNGDNPLYYVDLHPGNIIVSRKADGTEEMHLVDMEWLLDAHGGVREASVVSPAARDSLSDETAVSPAARGPLSEPTVAILAKESPEGRGPPGTSIMTLKEFVLYRFKCLLAFVEEKGGKAFPKIEVTP